MRSIGNQFPTDLTVSQAFSRRGWIENAVLEEKGQILCRILWLGCSLPDEKWLIILRVSFKDRQLSDDYKVLIL